jgi:hypothetical protein
LAIDPSIVQANHSIRQSLGSFLIVSDQNDGHAMLPIDDSKQVHDFSGVAPVEVSCWFICQQ